MKAIPAAWASLAALLIVALIVGAIGLLIVRAERRAAARTEAPPPEART